MNYKNIIAVTRGDSMSFIVTLEKNGNAVAFEQGDTVYFTVKKRAGASKKELYKAVSEFDENGAAVFELTAEETKGLRPGSYVYDVQYTDAAGNVITIIRPSCFHVTKEVTDD